MAGGKKQALTPVERLQELSLINKVTEEMASALNGLQDKTLSEFVIALTETEVKRLLKGATADTVQAAQSLRAKLTENGAANLSLSLCSQLVELVRDQSPRVARFQKKLLEKEQQQVAGVKGDGVGGDQPYVLSSMDESARKQELGGVFPGLAKANLVQSVPLNDNFYEHSVEDRKRESSQRKGLSNLPAWMTKPEDEKEAPPSKRARGETLELYGIYQGTVRKILDFGMVVGFTVAGESQEGLVHNAHISKTRVEHASEAGFKREKSVWVKVISMTAGKIVLSTKDVEQGSGKDLMPHRSLAAADTALQQRPISNSVDTKKGMSSASVVHPGLDVAALKRREAEEEASRIVSTHGVHGHYGPASAGGKGRPADGGGRTVRRAKQLTEQELFEAQQLIRSGVLPVEQYPTYDAEGGMGMLAVEETEEETDVELADVEPNFLRGQTSRSGRDLEPIRIVKNPDGSLQRSAMQQVSLAKERRELRQAQANQLIDSIPKDLNRPWEDPLPEAGERHFAQELRSINMSSFDGAPEWKKKAENKTLSYGIISNKSIMEQRESLPIYRLKKELMEAITNNQVLVVIGETGSGTWTMVVVK